MTRFWWVRHGPTHEKAFVGWRDVPADLSDRDRIARLSNYLPGSAVLVASDLSRASATAAALGKGRDRLPDDPALREFDFGAWDGLRWDAVAARDPELSRRFWEEPGDLAPPGGESWNALAARVGAVIDRLCVTQRGRDIVCVAHFGVILTQVQRATGGSAHAALGHRIDPLTVTEISHDGAGWHLGRINHVP